MNPFDRTKAYNELPFLPPKIDLETKEVLLKTISASRVLAQLNGAITNLPNPHLFLDTIHFQEAKASSEIENIITTNDDLYQEIVAERRFSNPAAKEVINYKEALWYALEKIDEVPIITTNLCIGIMQRIKGNNSGIRKNKGTTLSNSFGEVIYTPPQGEQLIRDKMSNLEYFINEESALDPLIKMALMHYQFEAIHPFIDGNGRTGRILMLLHLKLNGLLDLPAIYLSEFIMLNKNEYYKRIRAVTEQEDWISWIIYMLEMVESTAQKGIKRLKAIIDLMDEFGNRMKKELPQIYSFELLEALFRLPYTKTKALVNAGLGTRKTVGKHLALLDEKGFLKSTPLGREKLYLNKALMDILNG